MKRKGKSAPRLNSKGPSFSAITKETARLQAQNTLLREQGRAKQLLLENSLTSLTAGLTGDFPGRDNIASFNPALRANLYAPLTINWTLIMYMYKSHGLVQTMTDVPVLDAFRHGIDIISDDLDGGQQGELLAAFEEEGDLAAIKQAGIWTRLFGGGAIIKNVEDDPARPFDHARMGDKLELYPASRWELGSSQRIPATGKYQFYGQTLDASRVLTIMGKRAPFVIENQLAGWGMSELERTLEDINLFLRVRNVIYELLEEAKVDVYGLKDFTTQLMSPQGTAVTQKRVQNMNQLKSYLNALIMDKDDVYEQKQVGFSGLAEMMKEARIGVASALRMPLSKLFGIASTGFQSGEDDIENYNAMVESEIRAPLRPVVLSVLRDRARMLFKTKNDLDLDFAYRPMRTLTADMDEQVKSSKTTRYTSLFQARVIDSKELGEMLTKENLVPVPIKAEQGLMDPFPAAPDPLGEGEGAQDTPDSAQDGAAVPSSGGGTDPEDPETTKDADKPKGQDGTAKAAKTDKKTVKVR